MQRSNYAAAKDAQSKLRKEECALGTANSRDKRRRICLPSPFLNKSWPQPLCDTAASSSIGDLLSTYKQIQSQLETSGDILIRVVTWNQQARESPECLTKLLFPHKYHIVAVGTQECENSFFKCMIQPAKPNWESCLESALGCSEDYDILRSHSLQASHM